MIPGYLLCMIQREAAGISKIQLSPIVRILSASAAGGLVRKRQLSLLIRASAMAIAARGDGTFIAASERDGQVSFGWYHRRWGPPSWFLPKYYGACRARLIPYEAAFSATN